MLDQTRHRAQLISHLGVGECRTLLLDFSGFLARTAAVMRRVCLRLRHAHFNEASCSATTLWEPSGLWRNSGVDTVPSRISSPQHILE